MEARGQAGRRATASCRARNMPGSSATTLIELRGCSTRTTSRFARRPVRRRAGRRPRTRLPPPPPRRRRLVVDPVRPSNRIVRSMAELDQRHSFSSFSSARARVRVRGRRVAEPAEADMRVADTAGMVEPAPAASEPPSAKDRGVPAQRRPRKPRRGRRGRRAGRGAEVANEATTSPAPEPAPEPAPSLELEPPPPPPTRDGRRTRCQVDVNRVTPTDVDVNRVVSVDAEVGGLGDGRERAARYAREDAARGRGSGARMRSARRGSRGRRGRRRPGWRVGDSREGRARRRARRSSTPSITTRRRTGPPCSGRRREKRGRSAGGGGEPRGGLR